MQPTQKRPSIPWQGAMLEVDPDTGAVIGLAVVAGDTDTEDKIRETICRILPGFIEAADNRAVVNSQQQEERNEDETERF